MRITGWQFDRKEQSWFFGRVSVWCQINENEVVVEFWDENENLVVSYPVQNKYDVRSFENGVYFIVSKDKNGIVLSKQKFVKR